jgi:hypothetical protein
VPRTLSDPFIPIAHWRWLYFCSSRAWDMLNCTLGRLDACMAGFLGEAGSEPPYCPPPAAMPRLVQKATMEDGMSSWEKIKHQPCVFFRSLFALLTRLGEAIAMACFLLLTLPPLPPARFRSALFVTAHFLIYRSIRTLRVTAFLCLLRFCLLRFFLCLLRGHGFLRRWMVLNGSAKCRAVPDALSKSTSKPPRPLPLPCSRQFSQCRSGSRRSSFPRPRSASAAWRHW